MSLAAPRGAAAKLAPPARKPILLFFYSRTSGPCRRAEGFLAQVLQRGHNHATFTLHRIDSGLRPDLAERLGVDVVPALVVLEDKRVRARLDEPKGCIDIEAALAPWLH